MSHRWTEEDLKQVRTRVRGSLSGKAQSVGTRIGIETSPLKHGSIAGVKPAPSPSLSKWAPYKSKLEYNFAQRLELEKKCGVIDEWLYEPFSFMLASGKRYRVDFVTWKYVKVILAIGEQRFNPVISCYECKGWHKNFRDSMTHLKWAAQRFPFFQWKKVVSNGKQGFEVMEVRV